MGASILPARRRSRLPALVLLVLALALALVAGAVPVGPVQAQPAQDGITVSVEGLDEVVVGVPSPVRITVRVAERGQLRPEDPLRLLGELDPWDGEEGGLTLALATDGEPAEVPVDEAGRFVLPSADGAPLTLAGTPALESAQGHELTLLVTAEDDQERQLTVGLAASNERAAAVVRHAGAERTATAAAVSAASFNPGVDVAYVARADAFPDALAAGPAAGIAGAPILLAHRDSVPTATAAELQRLRPGRIVVLGGAAAVSDAVVDRLDGLATGGATRMAGADRFATAAVVARRHFDGPIETAYVATGTNFADALSGGPAAARAGAPLLLVTRDTVPAATEAALRDLAPDRIVVLGGSAAVGDEVVGRLGRLAQGGVVRYAGSDRFATSAAVSARSFPAGGVTAAYLATGANFPDSLAGAPAAARDGAPLLLVTRDGIPAPVEAELRRLQPGVVVLLGGTGVVGAGVADAVASLTRTIEPDPDRFSPLGAPVTGALSPSGELEVAPLDPEGPVGMRPGQRFSLEITAPREGSYVVEHRPAAGGDWEPLGNRTATGDLEAGTQAIALNAPTDLGAFDLRLRFTRATGSQEVVLANALTTSVPFRPPLFSSLMEGVDGQTQVIAVSPVNGLEDGIRLDADLSDAAAAGVDYSGATLVQTSGTGTARLVFDRPAGEDGAPGCRVCIEYTAGPGDLHQEGSPARPTPIVGFRLDGVDVPELHETFVGRFFRYDIMHGVRWTFLVGDGGAVASPQLSDLEPGVDHQPQLASFALPGRDAITALEPWESVVFDLSEAERGAVDYADAWASVIGGGHGEEPPGHEPPPVGFAELEVVEDEEAYLVFTAGPEGVPGVSPEGPLVEIFIGGVAADDEEATYEATVTRSDADAVSMASFAVRRAGLLDPSATDLAAGETDQAQSFAVTLDGDIDPGHLVVVELGGAQRGAVDYAGADVTVSGGAGTATIAVSDEGDWLDAAIAYTTAAGDGDGTRLVFDVTGVATDAVDETHAVHFRRDDSFRSAVATFDVGAGAPFASPWVSDLDAGQDDTFQSAGFVLVEPLEPGQSVTLDLSAAEVGGAGYAGAAGVAYDQSEEQPLELAVVPDASALVRFTAGEAGVPAGTPVDFYLWGIQTDAVEEVHPATFARDGDALTSTVSFAIRRVPTLADVSATDLPPDTIGATQVLRATVVEDLVPGETLFINLEDAERGAAAYGGARLAVGPGASGTARLDVFRGEYAALVYEPGPGGDPDGTELVFTLMGVNTDPGDETHVAEFFREGELHYSMRSALFDIGAGGPFVGLPRVSDLFVGDEWQWFSARLTQGLAPGGTVTFDLSQAQAGAVDYSGAVPVFTSAGGSAALDVDGDSALLTFTAGPGGVRPAARIWIDLVGVSVEPTDDAYTVTVTAPGAQTTTQFRVYDWDHGEEAPAVGVRSGAPLPEALRRR